MASFAILSALTVSFALITPVYGGLDERAHVIYGLAVVQGEVPVDNRHAVVEKWASSTWDGCWAADIAKSSRCMSPMTDETSQAKALTSAANYPPLYYALVSWPSFFLAGSKAFYTIRVLSALVFSALAAIGTTALGFARGKPVLSVLAMLAITPSSLAIAGFVNPQALEIGAAIATAGLLIPLVDEVHDAARRLVLASVTVFLWIQARPVGPVWAIALCVLVLAMLTRARLRGLLRLRAFWLFLGCAVGSSSLWLWWRIVAPAKVIDADACDLGCSISHVISSEDLLQAVATTGALNVHPPSLFTVPYFAALLAIVVLALICAPARRAAVISLGFLVLVAMALAIQIAQGGHGGAMWQARYALPLSLPLLMLCLNQVAGWRGLSNGAIRRFSVFTAFAYAFCTIPFALFAAERFWLGVHRSNLFKVTWARVPEQVDHGIIAICAACLALLAMACFLRIDTADSSTQSA